MAEKIDLGNVKGKDGISISSLETIHTEDPQIDILRITLSNEEVFDYEITNNKYITLVNEIVDDDMSVPTSRALLYALDEFFGNYYPKTESDLRYARLVHSHIKEEITDFSVNLEPSANNLVDLNDIRDTGFYYVTGNTSTQYVSNMPRADSSFYLIVERGQSSGYVKQTWTHYNQNIATVYVRTCNSNRWGNWQMQQPINYGHEYVPSTHNLSTNEWTGTCQYITELKIGTVIYYYLNQNPSSSSTTLNLTLPTNDGGTTTTGAKNILMYSGDNITNKFSKGSLIGLVYTGYNWIVINPILPNSNASTITMNGATALAGSSNMFARADHRHPSDDSKADNIHPHETTDITHPSALSNLNTNADATQSAINTAIDSKLGSINTTITNQGAIVVDSQLTQSSTNPVESQAIYSAIQNKIEQGDIKGGTNICKGTPLSNTSAGGTAYTVDSSTYHERPVYHIDNISKTSSQYSDIGFDISSNNFTNDDVFTFSFYIKGTSGKNFKTYFYGSNSIRSKRLVSNSTVTTNMNEGGSYGDGITEFALTSDWKKCYVTYHLQSTGGTASATKRVIVRVFGTSEAYVSNIQLERGYNATDYSDSDLAKADIGHTHPYTDLEDPIDINTNIDYNDMTTVGHYNIWNAQQTSNTNKPPNDTQGGLLVVNNIPNGTLQILYNYFMENPRIYYRIYHIERGWRSWQTLSVDGHTHNSTDIKSVKIPSGDDLNNYLVTGFYYNNANTEAQNITNIPESGKAFFLVVEDWGSTNYTKQTITHYGTGKTYIRIRQQGNWGAWKQLINIDNASSTAPLVDFYKTGAKTGTSTNYARADHQHTTFFNSSTGGETTACYVNILEMSVTASWNDRPITFTLQQRAKQTPTYVSIKLTNTNIDSSNYTIDKFVIWGNPMTLYLKQISVNKWYLIAYKPANDGYNVYDLESGNDNVEFVGKNTKWGSSAPTNENDAPLYTASYLVGATPFESTSSNIKANGTASVGSLDTVARADHIHPHNCVNNLTSTSTTAPLSANQGKELKTLVDAKINTSNIADNLTTNDATKVLSAKQGKVLNDTKVNTSSIVNNLTSTATNVPLSANQGKVLNDRINNKFNETKTLSSSQYQRVVTNDECKNNWSIKSNDGASVTITNDYVLVTGDQKTVSVTYGSEYDVRLSLNNIGTSPMFYNVRPKKNSSTIVDGGTISPNSTVEVDYDSDCFLTVIINATGVITNVPGASPNTTHKLVYEVSILVTTVNSMADIIYPIGSIYMSANATNPTYLFGGVWESLQNRFLLGAGSTYNNGATGGSANAVVVSHNHNIGNDDYYFVGKKKGDTAGTKRVTVPTSGSNYAYVSSGSSSFGNFSSTNNRGESGTGKNMPPYLAVYMWKRIA